MILEAENHVASVKLVSEIISILICCFYLDFISWCLEITIVVHIRKVLLLQHVIFVAPDYF